MFHLGVWVFVLLNWCMELQILIKKIVSTKSYFLGS